MITMTTGFSAIARSVMISAMLSIVTTLVKLRFSAIARSVMISAQRRRQKRQGCLGFSAIARSVMISAGLSNCIN